MNSPLLKWPVMAALILVGSVSLRAQMSAPTTGDVEQHPDWATSGHREGSIEFGFLLRDFSSPNVTVSNITIPLLGTNDATLKIKNAIVYGITFGGNIDDHWNINGDIGFGKANYEGTWGTDKLHSDGHLWVGDVNLEYNLFTGHFTPYVGAVLGLTSFDSGVPNDAGYVYWWDPWWGYTASGAYTTHRSTHWTWNAAAGLRWDLSESWTLKGSYQALWSKVGNGGTKLFPQYTLAFVWRWE